jgi:hypothetical protein
VKEGLLETGGLRVGIGRVGVADEVEVSDAVEDGPEGCVEAECRIGRAEG